MRTYPKPQPRFRRAYVVTAEHLTLDEDEHSGNALAIAYELTGQGARDTLEHVKPPCQRESWMGRTS
ncbi:MAG: hypothetical protein ACREXR_24520 [Gammaproteobacteria bacterium]